jgi:hypothetical protein
MIYEWKMDGEVRNFGHAIYELTYQKGQLDVWDQDDERLYFLNGSYVQENFIEEALDLEMDPVFVDCTWRGEYVDDFLAEQCYFWGVWGRNTAEMLESVGVEVEVNYNPIYNLPEKYGRSKPNALAAVVRNIKDPSDYSKDAVFSLKADGLFSPVVENRDDMIEMIKMVSGARFVLSGSVHVAMVADAYGIPFAPFSADGFVDCPEKWEDWLTSMGIEELAFCANVPEGREWYQSVVKGKV